MFQELRENQFPAVANHRLKLTDRLSLWSERPQLNLVVRPILWVDIWPQCDYIVTMNSI